RRVGRPESGGVGVCGRARRTGRGAGVSRIGRGATAPGRRAALPQPRYQPPPSTAVTPDEGLLVAFAGEDGRRAVFRIDRLPLPGWHRPLATAWARRIGPAGGLRTKASVRGAWGSVG